jgi:hypothetical protein
LHSTLSVSRGSSVSIVTELWGRWIGFDSRQKLRFFLLTSVPRQALGPTQPPIQWVPMILYPGVKQLKCKADHSPPLPKYIFMSWCFNYRMGTSSWNGT